MRNPLLTMQGLPPFSEILPEQMEAAITTVIQENQEAIELLVETNEHNTWENLVEHLEEMEDQLNRVWSLISHLNAVMDSEEIRRAYNACLGQLSEYSCWLGQHPKLYQAFRAIADDPFFSDLEPAQQKIVENTLREFHLSGVDLEEESKKRFREIQKRLAELSSKFSENVLDATMAWSKHFSEASPLAGLPEFALAAAQNAAKEKNLEGYVITLDFPSYQAVITYADDRNLRREIDEAYMTRASELGPFAEQWDNTPLMKEILELRHELAKLLGFKNYAELSLARKMADTPQQVMNFLQELASCSKGQGVREFVELENYARTRHQLESLEAWDLAYFSEKLKQERYAFSKEELRPYFPENRVLEGMFEIVRRVYGLQIKEVEGVDTWHDSVRFFEIQDQAGKSRGSFYLDLYARPHKKGGAWMQECLARFRKSNGTMQHPVAYLVCNTNKPIGDQPALLAHEEVLTLFHEFGHGLHHLLTQVDYPGVSGINGVAWDAVELPSQLMENWIWQKEALDLISRHYQTGEPLPAEKLERMLAARNFQSAMQMLRQLEFAWFDFSLHQEDFSEKAPQIQETLNQIRAQVSVVPASLFNRFQNGFSHIFSGGYAAGYYSYKWAEVLSADAFSRFEEEGIFNRQTGLDFLHSILEQGGSQEPGVLFQKFRGRAQSIEPLLRYSGIHSGSSAQDRSLP